MLSGMQTMQLEIHGTAAARGWYETDRGIPEMLCLIHSGVSKALEAHRDGDDSLFAEELADVVIRVMDLCEHLGICRACQAIDACRVDRRCHQGDEFV